MDCKTQKAFICNEAVPNAKECESAQKATMCEHGKFAGAYVSAHQWRLPVEQWNRDNCHSCTPLHLETSVCQRIFKMLYPEDISGSLVFGFFHSVLGGEFRVYCFFSARVGF